MDGLAGSVPAVEPGIAVGKADCRGAWARAGGAGRPLPPLVVSAAARVVDVICLVAAAMLVWRHDFDSELVERHARVAIAIGCVMSVLVLARAGYAIVGLRSRGRQAAAVVGALGAGLLAAAACVAGLQEGNPFATGWLWAWFVAALALVAGGRAVLFALIRMLDKNGALGRRILIVGSPEIGRQLAGRAAMAGADWCVLGIYDDRTFRAIDGAQHAAESTDGPLERCRESGIDAVVIALRPTEAARIAALRRRFAVTVADVYWSAEFPELGGDGGAVAGLPCGPALVLQRRPLAEWQCMQKRLFDLLLASVLIVLLSPLMAATALAVKLTSAGPVLFRQPRVGFNNQMLEILKFRTMYDHCADLLADEQTTRHDRRVTRIGRWLRRFSLDELPQLFNVLGGSMSIVGPRPHAPNTKAGGRLFADLVVDYALRHRVKPGITGWAQVNGWRGETQTVEQIETRVIYDLHYINNWSLLLDVKIVLMTVSGGFLSSRAY